MPVFVRVVPAEPYGALPRISLHIENGRQAGRLLEHGDAAVPIRWLAVDRDKAIAWAQETGYIVVGEEQESFMPRPGLTPSIGPTVISALLQELKDFDPERARREYPWASRFVMGLPLAPWQRRFVWSQEQCSRFITSIWTGVHLGNYVVTDMELVPRSRGVEFIPLSGCVIDGQQRLTALELYVTDQLPVPDVSGRPRFYSELTAVDARRFARTVFSRGTLREFDERKLKETYLLMNFSGTPHTEADRALVESRSNPGDCAVDASDDAAESPRA